MTHFDGSAKIKFEEWKHLIEVGIQAQALSVVQQVEFMQGGKWNY